MDNVFKTLRSVALAAMALFAVGAAVWFFMRDTRTSFQDILFWVGAGPIALFSLGFFGEFFGRGNAAYQLSRSVGKASSNDRGLQDEQDRKAKTRFSLSWMLAGGIVWLVSYFL